MYNSIMPGFSIMAKPTGPLCNINCSYCYYLEKEKMYAETADFKMKEETLEIFTRKYIHEQPGPEVTFVWQGGEPTLMGLDYYKTALDLQRKYGSGKRITNSFQTNGILLNDEWCTFFKTNNFLIGISIDGPESIHDVYRLNRGGQGTFSKVMRGIDLLKKHRIEFNTLTVINNINSAYPKEVYSFLKKIGSKYMQFIPIAERIASGVHNKDLALVLPEYSTSTTLAPWSVSALQYGKFLKTIFQEWVKKDIGTYFVQTFDSALANEVGVNPGLCSFAESCGDALVMEHNGDLYACDHYVYPEYKVGNIKEGLLKKIILSDKQQQFGRNKHEALPASCKNCDVYTYCRGECPKHRFLKDAQGEPHLNYFCEGYKLFFRYAKPYIRYMANELRNQRPAANAMLLFGKNNTFR